ALQHLNVATNALETIPSKVGYLEDLRTLRLGFNALATIPSSIGFLMKLEVLDLEGNPLIFPFNVLQKRGFKSCDASASVA
ncbi:hypothetical protein T484DRAFT_1778360, partial [Baffinella frigidus]